MPLASPTLAVTDNADGTGGVATVAGSNVAATNTVSHAVFHGTLGSLTWTTDGSRTGDGTVAVVPGNGYYLWRCVSVLAGEQTLSNVVFQNLTDAVKAVHYRILLAVQARIQGLALTGISSVEVRLLPRYLPGKDTLPMITVSPVGTDPSVGNMMGLDDIGYPAFITIIEKADQDLWTNLDRYLLWRQKISEALRHQHLAGVTETWLVEYNPDQIISPQLFYDKDLRYGAMSLRCKTRRPRGT